MPVTFNAQITTKWGGLPKWVLFRSACYLGGEGLTFGEPIVPHLAKMFGKSSIDIDVLVTPEVDFLDVNLTAFADGKMDHAFIGPRLELVEDPPKLIKEYAKKLAVGGHLVVALKIQNPEQNVRWHFHADEIDVMVTEAGKWQKKAEIIREGVALNIYKKLEGKKGILPIKPKSTKKRACIARYGALGDMIIITPLIHQLHEDGYEVTMNISPYALPIIEHNPYISNVVIQEKDMVPNLELGAYWDEWKGEYDKYINLSETLEGRFLKVEGRRDFYTPKEWRVKTGEHNYYEYTMRCGGYDFKPGTKGELYFTNAEERRAQQFFNQYRGKFVIIWALNGSSHHKCYPNLPTVAQEWLNRHEDSIIITVGDQMAKLLEFDHMRMVKMAGKWIVRESLIATKYANLIIGPETMMTNAAACFNTPKITMLSHSTHDALCKHWENDYCLAPDVEKAPCYPCFQLHYSKESCPIKQMVDFSVVPNSILAEAPACALDGISPERVLARMEEVYQNHFTSQKSLVVL